MARPWSSDIIGVLRGAQTVANAIMKHQGESAKKVLDNSSIVSSAGASFRDLSEKLRDTDPSKVPSGVSLIDDLELLQEKLLSETKELVNRICVVEKGISEYTKHRASEVLGFPIDSADNRRPNSSPQLEVYNPAKDPREIKVKKRVESADMTNATAQSTTFPDTKAKILKENVISVPKTYNSVKEKIEIIGKLDKSIPKIELTAKDKKLLRKLELEHEQKIVKAVPKEVPDSLSGGKAEDKSETEKKKVDAVVKPKVKPVIKPRQTLSSSAKERKVPSTRIQRMVSFGTLGVGLGIGTLAEYGRRTLGFKEASVGQSLDSMFLTKANAERIVSTLCKVRGAALKIGQILSIQDNSVISPELQSAFERVRQSADFMPTWQVRKVLDNQLGTDWTEKVVTFEEKPFAAASIGQVHLVTLPDGQSAAMKIQYPGVAEGIQSDIDNLVGVMKVWNMFPEGMFIDNVVEVAKRELSWEVDYIREAECSKKFKELLAPYPDYYVPTVIDQLCSEKVFTTELIDGVPVDKCSEMDIETREHICKLIMELCLKELFVFRYMQTDPNWANFFYNPETRKMTLLDFGACRAYEKSFMDDYIEIINGASHDDRNKVLELSRKMKFLTGYESKSMENAHVDAVMILGQVFNEKNEKYDFGGQNVTKGIQKLVPTIINERLCPPPEEIYSLHRKLSGVFLLCAKLNVSINCREMFKRIYDNYRFG